MPCVQCCRCQSSEVVFSRWWLSPGDLWLIATLRRPYRCRACLHRFAGWSATPERKIRPRAKWCRPKTVMQTATVAFMAILALLTGSPVQAEIVYTTANTVGMASSSNTRAPSTSNGYKIGTFGSSTSPSFSFTNGSGGTRLPSIQFTTSNFSDTQHLTGVNINLFVQGSGGGANSIQGGTLHWDLYRMDINAAAKVASFTSALTGISYNGSGFSTSQYQNSPFQMVGTGSSDELLKQTRYTLLLRSIDNLTTSNSAKDASLYWTYFTGTAAGGSYSLDNAGYVNSPFTGTSTFTNENLAFDINIRAAPEPGTLLLGVIASSAGGGAVWWRRRKKPPVQVMEEENPPA